MLDRSHQEAERRLTSGSGPVNIWEAWETVTDAVSEPLRVDCVWQLCGWGSVCDDANAKAAKCAHRQAVKKSVLSYLTSTFVSALVLEGSHDTSMPEYTF
jgi:hypothetical protein